MCCEKHVLETSFESEVKKTIYITYISSVDRAVIPTANACCFPSAITA